MNKKILLLLSVLYLTVLLSACTKTFNEDELENANFNDEILSITCTNTLDEIMSDEYEPKFIFSNNYKQGDIPYLNFDFEGKDTVNNLIKAYLLAYHSDHAYYESLDTYEEALSIYFNVKTTKIDDKYLFLSIYLSRAYYGDIYDLIGIDLTSKKILNNEEILNIFNYDKESLLKEVIEQTEQYNLISNESLTNIIDDLIIRKGLYLGTELFNEESNINCYGKRIHTVKYLDIIKEEVDSYNPEKELTYHDINKAYLYINDNNKLEFVFYTHVDAGDHASKIELK